MESWKVTQLKEKIKKNNIIKENKLIFNGNIINNKDLLLN